MTRCMGEHKPGSNVQAAYRVWTDTKWARYLCADCADQSPYREYPRTPANPQTPRGDSRD